MMPSVSQPAWDAIVVENLDLKIRLAEALRVLDTIDEEGDDHYYGIADRARMILRGIVTHGDCSGPTVNRTADSASAVQPERCCLDYPRCDCNSPPEPDNEWHCSQYPDCECFAGCREKALEAFEERAASTVTQDAAP